MLVFIDESGDLGFKMDKGSSGFFTIALAVFEGGDTALACQRGIGSGDQTFRRQMQDYLRRQINTKQRRHIKKVKIGRSHGDPLLQLADYVAGVTNRLYQGKPGAEAYDAYLRRKRRSQRLWP